MTADDRQRQEDIRDRIHIDCPLVRNFSEFAHDFDLYKQQRDADKKEADKESKATRKLVDDLDDAINNPRNGVVTEIRGFQEWKNAVTKSLWVIYSALACGIIGAFLGFILGR